MQDNHIYIIVCQTGTFVAKLLKLFTRKPYNHVSVACEETISEMYSFCRNTPRKPLPATFNKEVIGKGTLGKYSSIPCELYRINVTNEQKKNFNENLDFFKKNREIFSYNCIGLGLIFFNIPYSRKNKFVCSQFVGHILEKSGINSHLDKPIWLQTPEDFRHIPDAELIYKGNLNNYNKMYSNEALEQLPVRSA